MQSAMTCVGLYIIILLFGAVGTFKVSFLPKADVEKNHSDDAHLNLQPAKEWFEDSVSVMP